MNETEQYRTALETIAAGNTDAAKLAAAALDDSTFDITEDWLDGVLKRHASGTYWEIPGAWNLIRAFETLPFALYVIEDDGDLTFVQFIETRGDVRRLIDELSAVTA